MVPNEALSPKLWVVAVLKVLRVCSFHFSSLSKYNQIPKIGFKVLKLCF